MRLPMLVVSVLLFSISGPLPAAAAKEAVPRTLDIYFLDMFGGGSTLIVTPMGESILIDTGSLEPEGRDAGRIFRATQYAGLKQIDHLITTHFHTDHFGAILPVSKMIPIKNFYDKGALPPETEEEWFKKLYPLYQEATKGQVKTIAVGDDLALQNDPSGKTPPVRLHCVAAEKRVEGFDGDIDAPVPGFEMQSPDDTDNARSIALLLSYGKFEFFAGGDITWNVEHHLAHPRNRIGVVDLFQVTHHGLDQSNNPLHLKAINPTVAVAMNGPRKGIQPNAFRALKQLPDLKALYQIHYNTQYGDAGNTQPEFIANMKDPRKEDWIKASVDARAGTYSITVGTDGPTRSYGVR